MGRSGVAKCVKKEALRANGLFALGAGVFDCDGCWTMAMRTGADDKTKR
jgi:hypothetical protein